MIACDSIDVMSALAPSPDYRIDLPPDVEICSCEESLALRRELAAACAELEQLGVVQPLIGGDVDWRPFCAECGVGVAFDGDRCCVSCGGSVCTVHDVARHLVAAGLRIEPGPYDHRRLALSRAWGQEGAGCD